MNRILRTFSAFAGMLMIWSCNSPDKIGVSSPDGKINVEVFTSEEGQPTYKIMREGKEVIAPSTLGFEFKNLPEIQSEWKIVSSDIANVHETWEQPWGERREVVDAHQQAVIHLKEMKAPHREMNLVFRVFDDGVGFRYEFPKWEGVDSVTILAENTHFQLTGDHKVWWIPGDWDIYEHLYHATPFSEIDATKYRGHDALAQTYIPYNAVNTPVTMRTADGLHLSFHEAALYDYAGMTLRIHPDSLLMTSELVGSDRLGYKAKVQLPFQTPWRTILITETAGELIESTTLLNLNEPNKIGDVSWFHPAKYVGIWWEMHLSKSTWDYGATQDMNSQYGKKPHGKHGATTENAKRHIDFAAKNGFTGMLVEGWNTGWEHWIGFEDREGVFDFVTPYPDYDIAEVVRYGKEKGVDVIMHHETSAAIMTYEQHLDTAYALMQHFGMHAVKTGYVGQLTVKGEYHHGQFMVNHYQKVLETAAKYKVAVNAHEPIKATGKRRTYPNAIAREGLRGQEFNAWSPDGGNPPEHLPIVAFTRMLAGPIDFTPGIFDIKMEKYKPDNQVNTTLAQQLALYVVLYSPIQMVPDLIENYEAHDDALQFIRDVGVDWETSKVLNGEVGEYVTIARKQRGTDSWFLGSITNEKARELNVDLSFLDDGLTYEATIYKDGENADWDQNPVDYAIENLDVNRDSALKLKLAPGGGCAISFLKK